MKLSLFLSLLGLISFRTYGQKIDSLRYANGCLYYHEYGTGEPLLLLTGGPGSSYQQLEEVAVTLGEKYRSILVEQRGTGRSVPTPFDSSTVNLQIAISDLNLLLSHLKLKPATILGHSWGGMLAMSYAAANPVHVKALILLDPGPYKLDPAMNQAFSNNQQSRLSVQELALRDSLAKKVRLGKATINEREQYEKIRMLPIVYKKREIDSLYVRIKKGGNNLRTSGLLLKSLFESGYDLTKTLPRFAGPIHIICGRQDPGAFVSYELKLLMPKAQLHWIEEAGHFPMFEQANQFYATLFKVLP